MSKRFNLKARDWIHQPDSKREFNDALFTEVSSRYAFVTRALSLGRDGAWKRALIGGLPATPEPNCLDLACGPGDITLALGERYAGGQVWGLDLCQAMLELAERRNQFEHVRFLKRDMCETGLEAESMDVVTGGYALRNAPSLEQALAEVFRLLRPGGVAAFLDFSKPPQRALQRLEHFVLMTWGSFWGLVLHGNPEVYAYIPRSLQTYPDRDALRQLLTDGGFIDISSRRFYFGAIEILQFRKPGE